MIEQRSQEWFEQRAGKFTGSKFAELIAKNKKTGEPLKSFYDCVWNVVVERMTGQFIEGVNASSLQWGKDVEPYALEAYELETGNVPELSGFIIHPDYEFAGCSPDGLIGNDGGIEIKCPKSSSIHLERFLSGVPEEYIPQIQGCMWVTGRKWWDFCSYDPRMPESHRLFIKRVHRDDEFISCLQESVLNAEKLVNDLLLKLGKQ